LSFLVVHVSLRETELNNYHLQSPIWVEGMHMTRCCCCFEGIICDIAVTTSVPCSPWHNTSHLGFGAPEPSVRCPWTLPLCYEDT
jgi:hypothetical protein